ncbi:hypothetical protein [Methylobacterium sp. WL120]|uniref:hypothetical protein n=1 Tax=Methylobacterium sp. WL120 TaxID=2603887 RepID=UPI0011CA0041|nr:hypothetical protein [Methylobacterium sp. WL120]TXM67832.1 hypothetical protein FV229_09350 [Methylobacterium sp. WL120]
MSKVLTGLAASVFALVATGALAQNPDAPLKGRDTDPVLPPQNQTPPERVRPNADAPPNDSTLSDKLRQSDGVIKPPGNAAPGMVVEPPNPNAGSMPVIKPGELPGQKPGTEAK